MKNEESAPPNLPGGGGYKREDNKRKVIETKNKAKSLHSLLFS
jgi:hypothetical protein